MVAILYLLGGLTSISSSLFSNIVSATAVPTLGSRVYERAAPASGTCSEFYTIDAGGQVSGTRKYFHVYLQGNLTDWPKGLHDNLNRQCGDVISVWRYKSDPWTYPEANPSNDFHVSFNNHIDVDTKCVEDAIWLSAPNGTDLQVYCDGLSYKGGDNPWTIWMDQGFP